MKPHFTPPAPPSSGIFNSQHPSVGGHPPIVLGALTTGCLRASAPLLTGVRFDAISSGVCSTHATMA